MHLRFWLAIISLYLPLGIYATPAPPAISAKDAATAFSEAHQLCTSEAGRLWHHSLCVPLMLVDAVSHAAVLDRPAPGAVQDGPIYRIELPAGMPIANTSVDYAGQRWSMMLWPLPMDTTHRQILLMHESYHSIQPGLGLTGSGGLGKNAHLDTLQGRIWLRAELTALKAALDTQGDSRKLAVQAALDFRAYRHSLFPQAQAEERGVELNEGLAESTGIDAVLSTSDARIAAASADIQAVEANASFVRSFAYATGPAYAELLDAVQPDWRVSVTADFAFAPAVAKAYGLTLAKPEKKTVDMLFADYDGTRIRSEEAARAQKLAARNAAFTKALVTGPTLTLPLHKFSISFDPRQVYALADHGSVYRTLHISDAWGELDVKGGMALIPPSFDRVTVPLAGNSQGQVIKGDGWTLKIGQDYQVEPTITRSDNYTLIHKRISSSTP